jgi:hypothetical protein
MAGHLEDLPSCRWSGRRMEPRQPQLVCLLSVYGTARMRQPRGVTTAFFPNNAAIIHHNPHLVVSPTELASADHRFVRRSRMPLLPLARSLAPRRLTRRRRFRSVLHRGGGDTGEVVGVADLSHRGAFVEEVLFFSEQGLLWDGRSRDIMSPFSRAPWAWIWPQ